MFPFRKSPRICPYILKAAFSINNFSYPNLTRQFFWTLKRLRGKVTVSNVIKQGPACSVEYSDLWTSVNHKTGIYFLFRAFVQRTFLKSLSFHIDKGLSPLLKQLCIFVFLLFRARLVREIVCILFLNIAVSIKIETIKHRRNRPPGQLLGLFVSFSWALQFPFNNNKIQNR